MRPGLRLKRTLFSYNMFHAKKNNVGIHYLYSDLEIWGTKIDSKSGHTGRVR